MRSVRALSKIFNFVYYSIHSNCGTTNDISGSGVGIEYAKLTTDEDDDEASAPTIFARNDMFRDKHTSSSWQKYTSAFTVTSSPALAFSKPTSNCTVLPDKSFSPFVIVTFSLELVV